MPAFGPVRATTAAAGPPALRGGEAGRDGGGGGAIADPRGNRGGWSGSWWCSSRRVPGMPRGCAGRRGAPAGSREHDAPVLEHVAPVRETERLQDVLLDQQHGDALRVDAAARPRRWPSPGSGPARATARRASAGAGATSGPARSRASAARRPRGCRRAARAAPRGGEDAVYTHSSISGPSRAARAGRRPARDSPPPSCREELPPLGHVRDAPRHDARRGQPGEALALEGRLAVAAGSSPETARRVVVLPAPLAPTSETISPSPTRRVTSCSTRTSP